MQRPTAVTVFGILNIVFAVLGIVAVLASVMMFAAVGTSSNNPVIQIIHDDPGYAAWMKFSIGQGIVTAVALLAAGIGLLNLQAWARTVSIAYAIYAIVMVLVGMVVNYFFLVQPMLEKAQGKSGPEAAAAIGGTFGSCFSLVYPILLLVFMLRSNVKAAFRPPVPAAGRQ